MASKNLKIAFIGTGIMGAPIAGHIIDAGYELTVYNRTKEKAADLIERGAAWADSVAEAAKDADVVITMVGFPTDVEEIYLAGEGLRASAKDGAYLIDLTTSAPELARDIAGAAEVCGKHAFDCPVTGGESGAIAGTLPAIIGATERDIEPVREVLETFTSKICCFGGAGMGQAAKLSNQVALASAAWWTTRCPARAVRGSPWRPCVSAYRARPRGARDLHLQDLLLRRCRQGPGREALQPGRPGERHGGHGRRPLLCPAKRSRRRAGERDHLRRHGQLRCHAAARP